MYNQVYISAVTKIYNTDSFGPVQLSMRFIVNCIQNLYNEINLLVWLIFNIFLKHFKIL